GCDRSLTGRRFLCGNSEKISNTCAGNVIAVPAADLAHAVAPQPTTATEPSSTRVTAVLSRGSLGGESCGNRSPPTAAGDYFKCHGHRRPAYGTVPARSTSWCAVEVAVRGGETSMTDAHELIPAARPVIDEEEIEAAVR